MLRRQYVSVRTQYMKSSSAYALLDHVHALRRGLTCSSNVYPKLSHNNIGIYAFGCINGTEALEIACERYKIVTGKKIRSDFNALFEHVVVLSESQYVLIEKRVGNAEAKRLAINSLKYYAKSIKAEFGFEPLSIDFHLDEGHYDNTGMFIRNIHAHVTFFNYDFLKKVAPLRHLMIKGKSDSGRTFQLNPNFEKMQDIVCESFKKLGFVRGESKNVTGVKHREKEQFVKEKIENLSSITREFDTKLEKLKNDLENAELVKASLELEIFEKKAEVIRWRREIDKLKDYASELAGLIKGKSLSAIRKFSIKYSQNYSLKVKR